MLSDHNGIEINNRKLVGKLQNSWRVNHTFLNDIWTKEISREILKYFELNQIENQTYKKLFDVVKIVL